MSPADNTEAVASRLLALDWAPHFDRTYSRTLLMREYLRRAALWAGVMGHEAPWPFFDIAAAVDPSVRADPALVATVNAGLSGIPLWGKVQDTAVWALHWAALAGARPELAGRAPDPFEPLLLMFERGGGFTQSAAMIDVDIAGVPPRSAAEYRSAQPLARLDPAFLDEADARRAGGAKAAVARFTRDDGRQIIKLRGRLDQPRLDLIRTILGLQPVGRLGDREDEEFGDRALADGNARLALWRKDDTSWSATLDYHPVVGQDVVDGVAALVGEAAAAAGLTIESRRNFPAAGRPVGQG